MTLLNFILLGISGLAIFSAIYFYSKFQNQKNLNSDDANDLRKKIAIKKTELLNMIQILTKKNGTLEEIKTELKLTSGINKDQLINKINFSLKDNSSWNKFIRDFESLNQDIIENIRLNNSITSSDIRLIALLKMDLNNKEIASLLCISSEGIKKARSRLRKKLNLDSSESLEESLLKL